MSIGTANNHSFSCFVSSFFVLPLVIIVITLPKFDCFLSTTIRTQTINNQHHYHYHQNKQHQSLINYPNIMTDTMLQSHNTNTNTANSDYSTAQTDELSKLKDMNVLHHRLQACNVTNYCFVNDKNNTDQYSPVDVNADVDTSSKKTDTMILKKTPYTETKYLNAVHVKTLVWKGVYLQSNGVAKNNTDTTTAINGNNNIPTENKKQESPFKNNNINKNIMEQNEPFYFVTALRVQDKVDMKSLRTIVKRVWPKRKSDSGMLIVQLAKQDFAEQLTGFQSGSMPPGWHSVPMTLFVDDYIIEDANLSIPSVGGKGGGEVSSSVMDQIASVPAKDIEDKESQQNDCTATATATAAVITDEEQIQTKLITDESLSHVIMSVGSGTKDYSLHVSLEDLFNSSIYHSYHDSNDDSNDESNNEIKCITPQYNNGYAVKRQICSFSRIRAEEISRRQQEEVKTIKNKPKVTQSLPINGESDSEILKKLDRKTFNVAAKKKGKTNLVKYMIELMGDEKFISYMKVDKPTKENRFAGEFDKNALHYAAWKGDLETITLLINASKKHDELGDIVNTISTGEGNYGKNPVFYAITQCRDDVVLLLLSHGANLLIINNKGQTACSLAVNKLQKETCEFMFQMEAHQLKSGGVFRDYRKSHSDGQRYGDIDPRFLRLGDVNVDEELLKEIGLSSRSPDLSSIDFQKMELPRSVRVTTALIRQMKWAKEQDEISKEKSKVGVSDVTEANDSSSNRVNGELRNGEKSNLLSETKSQQPVQYKSSNPVAKLLDGTEIDIMSLPTLQLQDILFTDGSHDDYELINHEEGLYILQFAVEEALSKLNESQNSDDDTSIINTSWGLDCEWRPSHISGEESPVAILQLSSGSRAFVIDVQSLIQHGIKDDSTELTSTETLLSETLTKLFRSTHIRILGFGIGQDLSKLAASFPHLPCFREFHSVIDLQSLSRHVYPGTSKQYMSSLQKAVAILLEKKLDKTEQCSQWDFRPLSASQLNYSSLDAAVLPKLLQKMADSNKTFERENGYFLRKYSHLQTSYRFNFLLDDGTAYRVPMGSIRWALKIKFSRQIWPTFKQTPAVPEVIPLHERALKASSKPGKNKEKKVKSENRKKRSPIAVSVLTGDLTNLPKPGIKLGYTKDSVIERVVTKQVIESLPDGTYLQYNRRGGIIELGNTFLLFVNFGAGRVHHKYRNEFYNDGRQVTFTIKQSRHEDGELLQTLLIPQDEAMYFKKSVLFFIRACSRDKFMFCGKAVYHRHEEKEDDLIDLILELTDFNELLDHSVNSDEEDGSTYMSIVASQQYQD